MTEHSDAVRWAIQVATSLTRQHHKMGEGTARKAARHLTVLTNKQHKAIVWFSQSQAWWRVIEDDKPQDKTPANKQSGGTF